MPIQDYCSQYSNGSLVFYKNGFLYSFLSKIHVETLYKYN